MMLWMGKKGFKPILKRLKQIGYDDTITIEIVCQHRREYLKSSKKILEKLNEV
jgi:sugar phosphate isomerase/epimerase